MSVDIFASSMWNICKPAKQSQPTFGAAPCLWLISSSDSQQHPASTRQLVRQCFPSDQRLPEGLHLCDWGKQEWLDRDSNINKIRYFVFWWTVLTRHEYTADREAHSHLQMGVFLQLSSATLKLVSCVASIVWQMPGTMFVHWFVKKRDWYDI